MSPVASSTTTPQIWAVFARTPRCGGLTGFWPAGGTKLATSTGSAGSDVSITRTPSVYQELYASVQGALGGRGARDRDLRPIERCQQAVAGRLDDRPTSSRYGCQQELVMSQLRGQQADPTRQDRHAYNGHDGGASKHAPDDGQRDRSEDEPCREEFDCRLGHRRIEGRLSTRQEDQPQCQRCAGHEQARYPVSHRRSSIARRETSSSWSSPLPC